MGLEMNIIINKVQIGDFDPNKIGENEKSCSNRSLIITDFDFKRYDSEPLKYGLIPIKKHLLYRQDKAVLFCLFLGRFSFFNLSPNQGLPLQLPPVRWP